MQRSKRRANDLKTHWHDGQSQHMTEEKPLFIPLRTEWFRQFEDGTKRTEYRAYGPRWNERTCRIGRSATISHGYSGKRMSGTVSSFDVLDHAHAPAGAREIYPDAAYIAAIGLRL